MPNENIENPTPEIPPAEPVSDQLADLANRQGGTSPIPEPLAVSPTPESAPAQQAQAEPAPTNPPSPLYPTDAKALADKSEDPPIGEAGKPNPPLEGGQSVIKNLLLKAKEMIQFRKRKKLDKILELARQKTTATAGQGKITNNDIEKLLRVSDATATRYLSQLVKEGRLTRQGNPRDAFYQLP